MKKLKSGKLVVLKFTGKKPKINKMPKKVRKFLNDLFSKFERSIYEN